MSNDDLDKVSVKFAKFGSEKHAQLGVQLTVDNIIPKARIFYTSRLGVGAEKARRPHAQP